MIQCAKERQTLRTSILVKIQILKTFCRKKKKKKDLSVEVIKVKPIPASIIFCKYQE